MYILVTIFKKDQTIERHIIALEMMPSSQLAMRLAHKDVHSIEMTKHTKAELKEMGYTRTGKQEPINV